MRFLTIPLLAATTMLTAAPADFHSYAPTPPMGWNSWDCFGTTVTEKQTKEQADFMAAKLKAHGWEYIVVDIQWYEASAKGHDYKPGAKLAMDDFSRLVPAVEKFPSSANGAGFKPLADYVHSKGLKFGIHMMRGISRQAVKQNTPIQGTTARAADIADTYLAVFNTREKAAPVPVPLASPAHIRDLWTQKNLGSFSTEFSPEVPPHGARLFLVNPVTL